MIGNSVYTVYMHSSDSGTPDSNAGGGSSGKRARATRSHICIVTLTEAILSANMDTLPDLFREQCAAYDGAAGLLLDARSMAGLSMVRLYRMLDSLTTVDMLIAVLFADRRRCALARLLHDTLIRKEPVDYFTDLRAAMDFLTGRD